MTYSLKQRLIRQASGVGALKVVSLGLGLLTSVLIARLLGPAAYGSYALVTSIVALLAMPLSAGLPGLLVREVARRQVDGDWGLFLGLKRRVVQLIGIASAIVLLGVLAFWKYADDAGEDSVLTNLIIALPLVPAMALNRTRAAMLRGLMKVFSSEIPESVVQPLGHLITLGTIALLFHLTVAGALGSLVLSTVLGLVVGQLILRRELRKLPSGQEPRYLTSQWLRALMPFTMMAAIFLVNAQISTVVLGALSSHEEVAFLRVADRGAQLVAMSMLIGNIVVAPYLAQFGKSGDSATLQKITTGSIRGTLAIAIPIAVTLILFGKPIVGAVFGESYAAPVWLPMVVLCLGQLANVFFGPAGTLLNMLGHENDALVGVGLGLIVNAAVAIATASAWGALGGALGVALGIVVWNIYFAYRVRTRLGIRCTPL